MSLNIDKQLQDLKLQISKLENKKDTYLDKMVKLEEKGSDFDEYLNLINALNNKIEELEKKEEGIFLSQFKNPHELADFVNNKINEALIENGLKSNKNYIKINENSKKEDIWKQFLNIVLDIKNASFENFIKL